MQMIQLTPSELQSLKKRHSWAGDGDREREQGRNLTDNIDWANPGRAKHSDKNT
jgi:hypothetical protein